MNLLYPEIEPVKVHSIHVQAPHCIYVEECGNSHGIPVIFLHGGPGSGAKAYHRRFFDPEHYRIIIFDQRGTGRSTPVGEITANTTQALIEDMEIIRNQLNIKRWLLFGGSWGVALALAYAEACPEHVSGMILRGTFMGSQPEVDWVFKQGVHRIFPDAWEKFAGHIPEKEHDNLVLAYYKRVMSERYEVRIAAAKEWADWTGRVVTYLLPASIDTENHGDPSPEVLKSLLDSVTVECHYTINDYFLQPLQLINEIAKVPSVPVIIIHGRRDLTCTLDASWLLHKALPDSRLIILPEAGHLASDATMIDALVTATDDMRLLIT